MKISKKGYVRRFVRLLNNKTTGFKYEYIKECAEYYSANTFDSSFVESDVMECIEDHCE